MYKIELKTNKQSKQQQQQKHNVERCKGHMSVELLKILLLLMSLKICLSQKSKMSLLPVLYHCWKRLFSIKP